MGRKILHVAETLKGGVSSIINVITTNKNFEHAVVGPIEHIGSIRNDVTVYGYSGKGRGIVRTLSMIFKTLICILKERPSIIHLHSSFSVILAPLLYFFRLFFLEKIIYQPHGVYYDPCMNNSKSKDFLVSIIERIFCLFVDSVVAISEYELSILSEKYSEKKINLVRNPTTIEPTSENLGKHSNYFLFVGRFDKQKSLNRLVKFWSEYKIGMLLKVVGECVQNESDRGSIDDNYVEFLGWRDADYVLNIMMNAKATIVPSQWEGFGLVAVESISVGTPVICSNVGGLNEIIIDRYNGYKFDYDNFEMALHRALILIDEIDYEDLSINSFEHSLKFSIENYLNEISSIYMVKGFTNG